MIVGLLLTVGGMVGDGVAVAGAKDKAKTLFEQERAEQVVKWLRSADEVEAAKQEAMSTAAKAARVGGVVVGVGAAAVLAYMLFKK